MLFIIAILSLATLICVGWVVFQLSKIIYYIIRAAMESPKKLIELQHPDFGLLTAEADSHTLWYGQLNGSLNIRFCIAGDVSGPDRILLDRLSASLADSSRLEQEARRFIYLQEPEVSSGIFVLESIDFLFPQAPDTVALEFCLSGDDEGVWRVEFVSGEPRFVVRDD